MASKIRRTTYTREFVEELLAPDEVSESSSSQDETNVKKVLEELMAASLLDLENRFTLYWQKLGRETDTSKLRDVISRSEKRLNTRFYQEVQSGKRPKACHAHRLAMKNCFDKLERELYGNKLTEDLFISKIVTLSEKSSIKNAGNRRRQNNELLTFLTGRLTYEEFHDTFLPALSKDHKHLADYVIAELDRIEEEIEESKCVACRTRQYVQVKRLAAHLLDMKAISLTMYSALRNPALNDNTKWAELRLEVSEVQVINALKKKFPDFYQEFQDQKLESLECCCPEREIVVPRVEGSVLNIQSEAGTDITPLDVVEEGGEEDFFNFQREDLEQVYKMTATPRGICLIINNKDLPNSELNVDRLESTFKRLQFMVATKAALTAEEMKKILEMYSKQDHSKYDAFMCIILSGGNGNCLFGSDNTCVPLSELTFHFKASLCPSLAGKPKIFFIEASRGRDKMNFLSIKDEDIADDADFLIGHSTSEAHKSIRKGWKQHFIDNLTTTLDESADQNDFLSCLLMTTQKVARLAMKTKGGATMQVPSVVSTLTKKFHLTSDPLWPHPGDQ